MLEFKLYKKYYSQNFLKFAKKVFKSSLIEKSKDKSLNALKKYIYKKYKISLENIFSKIGDSISFGESRDSYIFYIDENQKLNNIPIKEFISLLDYGNIEVRGSLLIKKFFNYFAENIHYLFTFYALSKNIGKDVD